MKNDEYQSTFVRKNNAELKQKTRYFHEVCDFQSVYTFAKIIDPTRKDNGKLIHFQKNTEKGWQHLHVKTNVLNGF